MCDRMGIDVWEVVDAAKTKPFGFMPFYPGPGLGGHCIPIDPFYLSWKAKQTGFDPRFIELAGHVNGGDAALRRRQGRRRAEHAGASRSTARRSWSPGSPTSATSTTCASRRRSTSWDCCTGRGAQVSYADPYVPTLHAPGLAGRPRPQGVEDHPRSASRSTTASSSSPTTRRSTTTRSSPKRTSIVDTRNAIKKRYPNVFRLGAPHARRPPGANDDRLSRLSRASYVERSDSAGQNIALQLGMGMEVVFWISAFVIVYCYVGYPLLLAVWARAGRPGPAQGADRRHARWPSISIIIAARNEAARLPARITNLLELNYPGPARDHRGLRRLDRRDRGRARPASAATSGVLEVPAGGKPLALNAGVAAATRRHPRVRRRPSAVLPRRPGRARRELRRPPGRRRHRAS